jgi:hypothetical protein
LAPAVLGRSLAPFPGHNDMMEVSQIPYFQITFWLIPEKTNPTELAPRLFTPVGLPRRTNPRPARDRAAERTRLTVRPRWPGSRTSATRPNEPETGEAKRTRDRRGIAWRNEPGRPSGAGWNVPERTRGSVIRHIASGFSMRSRRTGQPGERLTARRPCLINIVPPRGPLTRDPGGASGMAGRPRRFIARGCHWSYSTRDPARPWRHWSGTTGGTQKGHQCHPPARLGGGASDDLRSQRGDRSWVDEHAVHAHPAEILAAKAGSHTSRIPAMDI